MIVKVGRGKYTKHTLLPRIIPNDLVVLGKVKGEATFQAGILGRTQLAPAVPFFQILIGSTGVQSIEFMLNSVEEFCAVFCD